MLHGVFWAQCGISFVVWVAYGTWLWRRSARPCEGREPGSSSRDGLMGTLLLFAGIGVLVLGGWALAAIGGLDEGQLTPTGWALVAIVGLAFVHTQVCAAVRLASVALASVTSVPRSTSVNQEEGNR